MDSLRDSIEAETQDILRTKDSPLVSPDKIIEDSLTNFSWNQLAQIILVGLASFIDAQNSFVTVFTDAEPSWHCTDRSICSPSSNICDLPRSAWEWNGSKSKSIVSDFGIECSNPIAKALTSSAFFLGCTVGGFLIGAIPDSFWGRKKLLLTFCLATSVSLLLTGLTPNAWIYAFMRFMNGFTRSTIGSYVLVLVTERVGQRWRPRAGMIPFTLFVFGFMTLPGIAYVNREASWRVIYFCISLPALVYCVLLYLFAVESPRWLFLQGRREEAVNVLKSIGTVDQTTLKASIALPNFNQRTSVPSKTESIKNLFTRRWAFRRIIAVMIVGTGIAMSYYGMPFAISDLKVNFYLGEVLNAVIELPSFALAPFLLERFSRRSSLLAVNLIGGFSGILCAVLITLGGNGVELVFELVCFFCARMVFNILMVYTIELFPTSVRNTTTTMVRQSLVIGGTFSPIMVSLGRKNPFFSYGTFGLAFLIGCFATASLPETKGCSLSDTMEEQEQKESLRRSLIDTCH